MTIFHSLILSVLQGLTEFLPISSSGHLIILPKLFNWPDQGLAFDAVVHLGTSLAAIIYFRSLILDLIKGFIPAKLLKHEQTSGTERKQSRKFAYIILISTVPAVIVGLFFKSFIAGQLRSVSFVALNLTAWGIILILAEIYANRVSRPLSLSDMTYKKGVIIGLAQALALFPGTSRSGITISAGLLTELSRQDAVRFSFLMSIPVVLGAGMLSLLDLFSSASSTNFSVSAILVGLLGAFFSGLFAIHFLLKYINKKGLLYFGVYRLLLAGLLFTVFV